MALDQLNLDQKEILAQGTLLMVPKSPSPVACSVVWVAIVFGLSPSMEDFSYREKEC